MSDGGTIHEERGRKLASSGIGSGNAILVVLSPKLFGRSVIIGRSELVIGRRTGCDFVLPDPRISGRHARVSYAGGRRYVLEDLESTNGTYVNRRKITSARELAYGDRVVMGETIMRFFHEETLCDQA